MPKTKFEYITGGHDRELYSGLIRLHVLHHAAEEPIFGLGMVEELARHGYRISPGTLYPLLHRSEEHTSELQSLRHLVCRLLLEKKKRHTTHPQEQATTQRTTPPRNASHSG